jgi:L-seryl-tRNA(Ser) seleniumtransferase
VTRADPRRLIPRTDALLAEPRFVAAAERVGLRTVKACIAAAQQAARDGGIDPASVGDVAAAALPQAATSLRPVINATGVIVHTNLGRAPLSDAAVEAVRTAAAYTDLEWDRETGGRGRRGRGLMAALAAAVPAAEAVHVVNNGAAAAVLAATALAQGKEIVVSRGELVEIGDGFRLPELLVSTGARLREVGTTNRTTLADYAAAIGPQTGFILKVHPSNFVVTGFTSSVQTKELATLDAPVVSDIGSGLLQPHPLLPDEPDASTALRAGVALVTASGDKLLGGPQAGLLLGRRDVVERLRRHPLARALRVDKLTVAALEATLTGPSAPVRNALEADAAELRKRAEGLAEHLAEQGVRVDVVPSEGVVGGGGAPGRTLPGWAVALPATVAERLRQGTPCVAARVEADRCLLDLRSVSPTADEALAAAVVAALQRT